MSGRVTGGEALRGNADPLAFASPLATRDHTDRGAATARNFRYQYAYSAILLAAARSGDRPYTAIWCEQHNDILAEREDGRFDAYQVKTREPKGGPWTLNHPDLIASIKRFAELKRTFGDHIADCYSVTNAGIGHATAQSTSERRRVTNPVLLVKSITSAAMWVSATTLI